ncbi:type IV pilin [Haloarchaeobius amylolyticus]|uniref:type IV pilin n=1 Tax=Haloarchaeobius amylolyticus TaxID=1198296 RepID=UPI002270ED86|nr:type IV pilin [Haloarchaeobius amylolyticus]
MFGERGATSPVGLLLMAALAVVMVGAAGVVVFDAVPGVLADPPEASVDATVAANGANAQTLVVTHRGGDALPVEEFVVFVDDGGTVSETPLSAFLRRSADNDGKLRAGEAFGTTNLLSSSQVTVRVVHEPSNTVVAEARPPVPDSSPQVTDFDQQAPTQTYAGSQNGDGETTATDGGATVTMRGNQWRYIDHSYNVTSDTVLAFEFDSTAEGDIHGIGLADDKDNQDASRVVQVFGVQNWGENVSQFSGAAYYELGDGWVRYEVPIGQLYTGNTDYLVFVTDCDPNGPSHPANKCPAQNADGEPTAVSRFRNVRVYENTSSPAIRPVAAGIAA